MKDLANVVLPEGEEWATIPLLDPANVGRYVIYAWNSNVQYAQAVRIGKIGRSNVHCGRYGNARVTVCRTAHHAWIDDHPVGARMLGLYGKSWDR